jgi:hypothetical protein
MKFIVDIAQQLNLKVSHKANKTAHKKTNDNIKSHEQNMTSLINCLTLLNRCCFAYRVIEK